jgi:hypothetical protein
MINQTQIIKENLNSLESVVNWFSSPDRVLFHAISRIVRALITPVFQLLLGILVKRIFGLNKACSFSHATQLSLLRRYINSRLLSKSILKTAFSILGNHYEVVSVGISMLFRGTQVDCFSSMFIEQWVPRLDVGLVHTLFVSLVRLTSFPV